MRALIFGLIFGPCIAGLLGCGDDAPPPTFRVTFSAVADATPLEGVEITANGQSLGETDEDGLLRVDLRGREGMNVAYSVTCPDGHRAAATRPPLTLRKFQGLDPEAAERGIEIGVSCPPTNRRVAVIVRAGGQAGLPVRMGGAQVAVTDASGVAHFLVESPPNSVFRLALDTAANTTLRPQNPTSSFTVPDADAIVAFDMPFEVEQPTCPRGKRMVDGRCVRVRHHASSSFRPPQRVQRPH